MVMYIMNDKVKIIVDYISKEISSGENCELNCTLFEVNYNVVFLAPNPLKKINIPSILVIPKSDKINNRLILEVNNCDSLDLTEMLIDGGLVVQKLAAITNGCYSTMIIPILPSINENGIYFQHLSKECFELPENDKYFRIDEQIIRIINEAKEILKSKYKVTCLDKIFLNGYSSSGVFAQRFSLIHPEIIEIACIGGAIGSIPIPSKKIGYPLGIEDFDLLLNRPFDIKNYSQIKFVYYVGELEDKMKANNRFNEDLLPCPMHDMSYFDKSTPLEVGQKQRNLFGKNMFARINKIIEILTKIYGINIKLIVIPGRTHNNQSGHGVNEFTIRIPAKFYRQISEKEKRL